MVPDYESFMLPLLRATSDRKPHRLRDLVSAVADTLGLSVEDRSERTKGGDQTKLETRVRWAKVYLAHAGLLESVGRGTVRVTAEGIEALGREPDKINYRFLAQYPSFRAFRKHAGG